MVHNSAKTKDSNINARGELYVGNRRGVSLLSGLSARLCAHEDDLALIEEELALHRANLTELSDQVLALELLSTEYRKSRIQFIDTSKRNNLDASDDDSDGKIIREGYMAAEEGNALADAALYTLKERSDVTIFEELYELEPLQVLRISEC